MRVAFESLHCSLIDEEVGRISAYYGERGGFWVCIRDDRVIGMFGLEPAAPGCLELRRMYVDLSDCGGIASLMLRFAEDECRKREIHKVELGTSELQPAAIVIQEGRARLSPDMSNKTVGGGVGVSTEKAL